MSKYFLKSKPISNDVISVGEALKNHEEGLDRLQDPEDEIFMEILEKWKKVSAYAGEDEIQNVVSETIGILVKAPDAEPFVMSLSLEAVTEIGKACICHQVEECECAPPDESEKSQESEEEKSGDTAYSSLKVYPFANSRLLRFAAWIGEHGYG